MSYAEFLVAAGAIFLAIGLGLAAAAICVMLDERRMAVDKPSMDTIKELLEDSER